MKKVLVTGSNGFIGSHLMKALGDRGVGFDITNTGSKWNENINDYGALEAKIVFEQPEYIIHLAAISNRQDTDKDPQLALRTNIIGTYNVLSVAKKYGIRRVIIASSAATYEPEKSLYGTSKLSMESLANMFDNAYIVRFYNVYGKGGKGVVNKFVKRIKAGKEITLNGNTTRDYVHVNDVVKTLIMMTETEPLKIMEVGFGRSYSLKELVKIIERAYKVKAIVKHRPKLYEIQESKMNQTWNTFRNIPLEEGVMKL